MDTNRTKRPKSISSECFKSYKLNKITTEQMPSHLTFRSQSGVGSVLSFNSGY